MMRSFIGAALALALVATHADAAARPHKAVSHAARGMGVTIGKTAIPGHAKASSGHTFGAVLPTANCNPNFAPGQVPSAAQWNAPGACAFPAAGGLLGGPLGLPASTAATASLNISPGSAPTSPSNGDIWATSAGVFTQVNGSTVGPLGTGGGSSTITLASTALSGFTNTQVLQANGSVIGQVAASTTVNGQLCALGSTCTISAAASIVNSSTTMSGFTAGDVLVNNAGVAGQAAVTPNGTVGFPTIRRVTTGATDTASTSDSTIVIALGSAANFAETLPACVSGINGQTIIVKDEKGQAGANPITVKATTSTVDTIAGATGFIMNANFQSVGFQCDSAAASGNWMAE